MEPSGSTANDGQLSARDCSTRSHPSSIQRNTYSPVLTHQSPPSASSWNDWTQWRPVSTG